MLKMLIFWRLAGGYAFLPAHKKIITSGFAQAVDKYIIRRCVLGSGLSAGGVPHHPANDSY